MRFLAVISVLCHLVLSMFWLTVSQLALAGAASVTRNVDTKIVPSTTKYAAHGVAVVKTISSKDGSVRPLSHCVLQHGYVIDPTKLLDLQVGSGQNEKIDAFIASYYGEDLLPALLTEVCENIVVIVQEAVQSTLEELTRRTETIVSQLGCPKQARACALFGHSKGGAVATHMAMRCMRQTSLLKEEGCRRMKEFYSSAGTSWGALFAAVVYGIYLEDPNSPLLARMERFARQFGISLDFTGSEAMEYRPGESNPVWVDMGPIGPGPNGRPVLADRSLLDRKGWLQGDYAASSTAFDFEQDRVIAGCGRRAARPSRKSCAKASLILPFIHKPRYRAYFDAGMNAMRQDPRFVDPLTGTTEYLAGLTWKDFQLSDGLADYGLAMGACLSSGSAVTSCTRFESINHAANAGANREVILDVVEAFRH